MTDQDNVIQRVKALVERLRQQYASDPNVQTVGWGLAQRGGKPEDGISIVFYVKRKMSSARGIESLGSQPIPAEIEGFKTDVQEVKARPTADAAGDRDEIKYDPLRGGVASSNAEGHILWFNGWGTLGILARDNSDGSPVALSNWHVWGDGGSTGDRIIQPGHPTTGDHFEAIGKVIACGPLLTSLIEWTVPSPLTLGLYGGAAAAAIAAAASDYRDPTRRGQDNTPPHAGELTKQETVDMAIEYPNLPLPGVPFQTQVKWDYARETTTRLLTHSVAEDNTNTQILLGKLVVTDKARYLPGEVVTLTAAIWDYQPRPCDGYHVVAHLIPHNRPDTALRVVLHPTTCPRTIPVEPPKHDDPSEEVCLTFENYPNGEYSYKGAFSWLRYTSVSQDPVHIVRWFQNIPALQFPARGLSLEHVPAREVNLRVFRGAGTPITAVAFNAAGQVIDQVTEPAESGVMHDLTLRGDGIVNVFLRGGGNEGLLIRYCVTPLQIESFVADLGERLAARVRVEVPQLNLQGSRVHVNRCCFTGKIQLPPDEDPGKWDVHLTVQNINPVPEGTKPEVAATTIGGHLLSSHTSAQALGCTVIMLLDHVFDVI